MLERPANRKPESLLRLNQACRNMLNLAAQNRLQLWSNLGLKYARRQRGFLSIGKENPAVRRVDRLVEAQVVVRVIEAEWRVDDW